MDFSCSKVYEVFKEINRRKIDYCHFKSNVNLDISFSGNTDFDLLVSKKNISEIKLLLLEYGFKQRYTTYDKTYPLMEDFLLYDEDIDKIHHFHLHYDLFFGKKIDKNIFLNIDFMDYTILDNKYKINVLQPEMELILLVLRLIFKSEVSNIRYLITNRRLKLEKSVIRELEYLISTIDNELFNNILNDKFLDIKNSILKFINLYQNKYVSYINALNFQYQIKKSYKDSIFFINGEKYECLSNVKINAKPCSISWIQSGGKSIAIVGMDGSGKSSAVQELSSFLSIN
jgi:hypothetical protein